MPLFDFPLEKLRTYQPDVARPADFDAFWDRTLAETRSHPLDARFKRVASPIYKLVDVHDLTFNGWGGQPVKGWVIAPAGAAGAADVADAAHVACAVGAAGKRPAVVSYIGYGGGRSLPIDHLAPAIAGFVHVVMDTRGQGAAWSPGDTPDDAGGGPQHPGFMTRGIESRETYYYRRVIADAVRAVEAARAFDSVDAGRIAVRGGSQGGGLALAAAGLLGDGVKLLAADVPFLCHFRRATEIIDKLPYNEIARYLSVHRGRAEQVFETLSYFDGVNFAAGVRARSLFSVALMDMVCPPSTVFAAYNRISSPKDILVYGYNEHEGGGVYQMDAWLRFCAEHL